jgi:taurine dioxygenase
MSLSIVPLSGPLGAELRSFEPRVMEDADRALLRGAFLEFGVLVARELDLTPEEHVRLTHVFGRPAIHPIPTIRLQGHPEIIVLQADLGASLAPDDPTGDEVIGEIPWHSDLTYTETPSRGALLLARVVPPERGDTGYIDTAAVYDALPDSMRRRIEGLRAVHSLGPIQEQLRLATRMGADTEGGEAPTFQPVTHPLVQVHPESGRKVLNISPTFIRSIEGMQASESEALLDELKAFATQEHFAYYHHWAVGDLVIWDNRRTMHTATGHRKMHARCMHRTTLDGGEASGRVAA